jgi:hypothetical protein
MYSSNKIVNNGFVLFIALNFVFLMSCENQQSESNKIKVFISQNKLKGISTDSIAVISLKRINNKIVVDCLYKDVFQVPSRSNASLCFFDSQIFYCNELKSIDEILNKLDEDIRTINDRNYFAVELSYRAKDKNVAILQLFDNLLVDFEKANYDLDLYFFIYLSTSSNNCTSPPPLPISE